MLQTWLCMLQTYSCIIFRDLFYATIFLVLTREQKEKEKYLFHATDLSNNTNRT